MRVIILTPAQATAARRKYSAIAALDPQQLASGEWFLPLRVLRDPDIQSFVAGRALASRLRRRIAFADLAAPAISEKDFDELAQREEIELKDLIG